MWYKGDTVFVYFNVNYNAVINDEITDIILKCFYARHVAM